MNSTSRHDELRAILPLPPFPFLYEGASEAGTIELLVFPSTSEQAYISSDRPLLFRTSLTYQVRRVNMMGIYAPSLDIPQRTSPDGWGLNPVDEQRPVFPDTFRVKYETPTTLLRNRGSQHGIRYTHRDMPWWGFVLVDGACSNNGRLGAQGGWAVVYGPPTETGQPPQVVSGRLEEKGPFGCDFAPTSNRAELRASIAALRLCYWPHYGFKCLVIATDSSYVVEGATSWSKEWIRNGWRNAKGATVVNSDLWSLLLEEIRLWRSNGLRVLFWKIPRELNQEADSAAKAASLYGFREPQFIDWSMLPPPPSNPSTDMAPVRPLNRVLVICPQSKGLVDYRYSPLLSRIRHHAQVVELGQTTEEAVHLLRKRPAPDAILLTDGAICRDADIRWFVLAHIQASGSRVILTGDFGRSPDDDVDSVFDAFGVPWRRGGIIHQAVKNGDHLRREHPRLFSTMPTQHTQSGLSLLKVDVTESAYIPLHEEYSGESATAVRGVRDGFLCFVGDETPASEDIILAMCCQLQDKVDTVVHLGYLRVFTPDGPVFSYGGD